MLLRLFAANRRGAWPSRLCSGGDLVRQTSFSPASVRQHGSTGDPRQVQHIKWKGIELRDSDHHSPTPSSPAWTTAVVSCSGLPANPWTGSSTSSTQLPGSSLPPGPWQHITPTLIHLHWLLVKIPIKYEILLLTYESLLQLNLLHPGLCAPRTLVCSPLPIPVSTPLGIGPSALLNPPSGTLSPLAYAMPPSLDIYKTTLKTHLFNMTLHQ